MKIQVPNSELRLMIWWDDWDPCKNKWTSECKLINYCYYYDCILHGLLFWNCYYLLQLYIYMFLFCFCFFALWFIFQCNLCIASLNYHLHFFLFIRLIFFCFSFIWIYILFVHLYWYMFLSVARTSWKTAFGWILYTVLK